MRIHFLGNTCNNHYLIVKYLRKIGVDAHLFYNTTSDPQTYPQSEDSYLSDSLPDWIHPFGWKEMGESPYLEVKKEFLSVISECDFIQAEEKYLIWAYDSGKPYVWFPYGGDLLLYPFYSFWKNEFSTKQPENILIPIKLRRAIKKADAVLFGLYDKNLIKGFRLIDSLNDNFLHNYTLAIDDSKFNRNTHARINTLLKKEGVTAEAEGTVIFHPARIMISKDSYALKNNDTLFRALAEFKKTGRKFTLILLEKDNPDEILARQLIDSLGISERVIWIKKMPRYRLIDWYSASDIVADDFYSGCLGSIVFEGMACGTPVMTYFEQNWNTEEAWTSDHAFSERPPLINVRDEGEILESLCRFYDLPEELNHLGKESRRWIENNLSGDVIAPRFLALYESILSGKQKKENRPEKPGITEYEIAGQVNALVSEAKKLLQEKKFREAFDKLNEALDLVPENQELLFLLLKLLAASGYSESVVRLIDHLTRLFPENREWIDLLVEVKISLIEQKLAKGFITESRNIFEEIFPYVKDTPSYQKISSIADKYPRLPLGGGFREFLKDRSGVDESKQRKHFIRTGSILYITDSSKNWRDMPLRAGLQIRRYLQDQGWNVKIADRKFEGDKEVLDLAAGADIVYFAAGAGIELCDEIRKNTGSKTVIDITGTEDGKLYGQNGKHPYESYLDTADIIVTDLASRLNHPALAGSRAVHIPSLPGIERINSIRKIVSRDPEKVVIGCMPGKEIKELEKIRAVFRALYNKNTNLEFTVLGGGQQVMSVFEGLPVRVLTECSETDLIRESLRMDIAVSVGESGAGMSDGFENILFMAAGCIPVCLNTEHSNELVPTGKGIIADNELQMYAHLSELINSSGIRNSLSAQATKYVTETYCAEKICAAYESLFSSLLNCQKDRNTASLSNTASSLRKKILIVSSHFWPSKGGIETMALNLGKNLIKNGCQVDIATWTIPERKTDNYSGVNIISLDTHIVSRGVAYSLLQVQALIASGYYDTCIIRQDPQGELIWSVEDINIPDNTQLFISPIINQEGFSKWKDNKIFRQRLSSVLKKANAVVALTQNGPDVQFYSEEGINFVYIPNGGASSVSMGDFREEFGIPGSSFMILHVANLYWVKNHLGLLQALKDIPENWKLVMIGHATGDQDCAEAVLKELKLHPNVIFIPGLPPEKIADAMSGADVVVLSSKGEGAPLTILEAMAHKKAWVATPECGAANDFAGGIIAPLENFLDVLNIIYSDKQVKGRLEDLSFTHWKENFVWDKVIAGWVDLVKTRRLNRSFIPGEYIVKEKQDIYKAFSTALKTRPAEEVQNNVKIQKLKYVNIGMITYNRLEFTRKSIEALIENTDYPYVLSVVDNCSNDGTREYLLELKNCGIIKNLILLNDNLGVAKAANLAWLQEPDAQFYLKLDNDIVMQKHSWLADMVDVAVSIPEAGAVAYNFEPISYPASTVNDLTVRIKEKGSLGGACILIPGRTASVLGYWCEDYGLYGEEDADYGFRINAVGLLNIYMEDENAGFHLPAGKAAIIDSDTYIALDGKEEVDFREYRQWKDEQRKKNISKDGRFHSNLNSMSSGKRSLYYNTCFRYIDLKASGLIWKPVKVTIIIPVYNKLDYTVKCIESIYHNTDNIEDIEIIIVNNGSTDGTEEFLKSIASIRSNIIILSPNCNLGFARANNLASKSAHGNYLLLLNNDTEVQKGWLEPLIRLLDNDTEIAAVGSKLLFPDNTIQHAGVGIFSNMQINDPLLAKHLYIRKSADLSEANLLKTYQVLTAACLIVRKSAFDEVGGFDEEYWNGYEDVDLCFKLREKGYKLVYQPESVVIHYESQSGPERFSKVSKNIERLHSKWIGKIKPDFIIEKDGTTHATGANVIKEYFPPKNKKSAETAVERSKSIVSVIVLTYNGLKYNREFIESVRKHTKAAYELIVVDNASTDGTVEYLKGLEKKHSNVSVIYNETNLGFPVAVNQAIKASKGSYVLIANNDIVVTQGWLERMLQVAESDVKIGIVGPISNAVSGVQLDKKAKYKNMPEMHKYAKKVRKHNAGETMEFPRVAFLCTLIKREVIDAIGGLDERFSPGNYEDDDFCLRAEKAGYRAIVAKDVFIHHYGSKSFKADGERKYAERLEINKRKFVEKWGATIEEIWLEGKPTLERELYVPFDNELRVQTEVPGAGKTEELQGAENKEFCTENSDHNVSQGDMKMNKLALAEEYIEKNDLMAALTLLNEIIVADPRNVEALNDLAVVSILAGDINAAADFIEQVIKIDPYNDVALDNLTYLEQMVGETEDENQQAAPGETAELHLQNDDEMKGQFSPIISKAEELIDSGDLSSARKMLETVLMMEPENLDALNDLSVIEILEKNLTAAVNLIEKVIMSDPGNETALENLTYLQNEIDNL